nr:carbohydrate-binding domain-containing protein [Roseicella aerolata]
MVPPTGASAGFGYGLYSFTLSLTQGDVPGPYALIWPGTDVWPGPELDVMEALKGGPLYSTVHWKGEGNTDKYTSYMLEGVDPKQVHTYSLDWAPGRLTGYVDGKAMWTTTANVPKDFANGGENLAPGVGMQTWWSAKDQYGSGYDNRMTVFDVSYAKPNANYTDGNMPAPGPTPIKQTIGSGADSLVLNIAQDAWKGSAQYTISVNGKQVGGTLTASALRSGDQDDIITVKGDFASGVNKLTVHFLNDAYGGSAATDRNLYLEGASLNGTAIPGASKSLLSNGPVDIGFTKPAAGPTPIKQTIGSGADSLVLNIAQDAWKGDAQYTISVNGKQVGGTLTASALRSGDQDDIITVKGNFAAGANKVTVNFLNDAYGGSAATDRNLYLEGASLNGTAIPGASKSLLSNGPVDIGFTKPFSQTIGSGADSLVLNIAQDAWKGDAQYTVSVNGKQVGGIFTAVSLRSGDQDDILTIRGDFGPGTHKATVKFLNDAYGGSPAADRNLYVEGITYNGKWVDHSMKALLSNGPADFIFA